MADHQLDAIIRHLHRLVSPRQPAGLTDAELLRRFIDHRDQAAARFRPRPGLLSQRLPAGSMVTVSPYVTHRHPAFWEAPETFDPDRFSPQRSSGRPRFAYFPFLGGPHQCIGNEFAMMEARLIVALVAQAYRLNLAPSARIEAAPMLSLRPRHGVWMTAQATH
jgi:cytochrome P450